MQENKLYDQLWHENALKLKQNMLEFDPYLMGKPDSRMGISLILRLNENPTLMSNIKKFYQTFHQLDPNQHMSQTESLHVTLLSLVTCREHFEFNVFNLNQYVQVIQSAINDAIKATQKTKSINILFKGITISSSCILLRGFAMNDLLAEVRKNLRIHFNASDLEHTIDSRYSIQSAHCTMVRFKQPTRLPIKLYKLIKQNIDTDFGEVESTYCDLVINDWYHTKEKSTLLARFPLC